MKFLDLFKKKKKTKRNISPEEQRLIDIKVAEARKWQTILDNVILYDGTERGQKPIE
jgi:hypothetical protein